MGRVHLQSSRASGTVSSTFSCPEVLDFMPLVIDPSGLYVRPEGEIFLAGGPATPRSARRIPSRSTSTLRSSRNSSGPLWPYGFQLRRADQDDLGVGRSLEMNRFDQNLSSAGHRGSRG